jgi:methyl coenzyme M reductase subunit C-like uncharacterized protein (methanogenesis marker protein 7)
MSQYTKGPWRRCEEIPDVIIDSEGYVIAEHVSQDEMSLVIAAPCLLHALQNIENDNGQIPDHAWKVIQDAISKATTIQ